MGIKILNYKLAEGVFVPNVCCTIQGHYQITPFSDAGVKKYSVLCMLSFFPNEELYNAKVRPFQQLQHSVILESGSLTDIYTEIYNSLKSQFGNCEDI
jgi:hypothetical protein